MRIPIVGNLFSTTTITVAIITMVGVYITNHVQAAEKLLGVPVGGKRVYVAPFSYYLGIKA